jgi:stage II sporulation protein D
MRSEESLKAMAVVARTWAARFRGRHRSFDFCDSTHCQDLRPAEISGRIRAAVAATEGELLWYEGQPAATYYHRSCGGTTEDGQRLDPALRASYLRSHSDQYCLMRDRGEWQSEIDKSDLQRALAAAGIRMERVNGVSIQSRTFSGRAATLRVTGPSDRVLDAPTFRLAIGRTLGWERVRSDLYEIADAGDHLVFHGRGQGHGVGLCQVGAAQMGEQGSDYRQILAFYFPGTILGLTAQGIRWQRAAGERVDLLSTRPANDQALLGTAAHALQEAEAATGWTLSQRLQLKVYPTVAMFRDATGEPGWVAASTRGFIICLEPQETLRGAGVLDTTLRHEILHVLVEQHAHPSLPLWFREGLVLYLSQPNKTIPSRTLAPHFSLSQLESILRAAATREQLQRAYTEARERVAALAGRYGQPAVLSWCEKGLPGEVAGKTVH